MTLDDLAEEDVLRILLGAPTWWSTDDVVRSRFDRERRTGEDVFMSNLEEQQEIEAAEIDDEPGDIDGGDLSYDPYAGTALYYDDEFDPFENEFDLGLGEVDGGGQ